MIMDCGGVTSSRYRYQNPSSHFLHDAPPKKTGMDFSIAVFCLPTEEGFEPGARGRGNGSFPVAEILKPRGFKAQALASSRGRNPVQPVLRQAQYFYGYDRTEMACLYSFLQPENFLRWGN